MPKRTRDDDSDAFCSQIGTYNLFPTAADGLGMPGCDTTWALSTDADPTQMQFFDFGSMNIDIPSFQSVPLIDNHVYSNAHADTIAGPDFFAGYQTSNGSSVSVPSSRPTNASSAIFLPSSSSSSPDISASTEVHPHVEQASLCRSLSRSETCLTIALRALTILHIAHLSCLSAHRERPSSQQPRKMEAVLSTNKDVIAGMTSILACSCSSKSLMQLLLSSVCGNLITWNSAMINATFEQSGGNNNHGSTFSPAGSLSAGSTQGPRVHVLAQPITIGQHQISGSLARALLAQVMAGELRNLEGLVDALSCRFREAARLDDASNTSPRPHMKSLNNCAAAFRNNLSSQSTCLPVVLQRQITSTLRTRLQNTRANIFSQLGCAA